MNQGAPDGREPLLPRRSFLRWKPTMARKVFLLGIVSMSLVLLLGAGYLVATGIGVGDVKRFWRFGGIAAMIVGVAGCVANMALVRHLFGTIRDLTERVNRSLAGAGESHRTRAAADEMGRLVAAVDALIHGYETAVGDVDGHFLLSSGFGDLHRLLFGGRESDDVCGLSLELLTDVLDLNGCAIYRMDDQGAPACACRLPDGLYPASRRAPSQGHDPVAQAAQKKNTCLFRIDADKAGETAVATIDQANGITVPIPWQKGVLGVLRLERTDGFSSFHLRFAQDAAGMIGAALTLRSMLGRESDQMAKLSEQARTIETLRAERVSREKELEDRHQAFEASQRTLRLKQLETEAANAQMVKNAADLEANMAILESQNRELEAARRALEEKARELEVSSQYKTAFLANMSHELRTPLNSILLLSRLLRENEGRPLTDKRLEFAKTIHSAGEDLLNLIDEVLDLATVESGKMAVTLAPVPIRSIVDTMGEIFAPLAEQKGLDFITLVAPVVPDRLVTDRKRIEQIIKNFLSNAFKFTERGAVTLEIDVAKGGDRCRRKERHGPDQGCLTISVIDTGIGIPAAKHRMVFDAFQQVDGSTRRKYGGTGLGLSISRQLAQLLGGDITLASQAGEGSQFTLHLPMLSDKAEAPAILRQHAIEDEKRKRRREPLSVDARDDARPDDDRDRRAAIHSPGSLQGRSVLLADDDMRTVFALTNVLEAKGALVLAGKTGKESLDKLDGFPEIDLIIMDVMISGIDGYEAIRTIRSRKPYRNLPIVALTAKAMKGDRSKCIAAGANDYLAKPVNLDALMVIIDTWVDPLDSEARRTEGSVNPD